MCKKKLYLSVYMYSVFSKPYQIIEICPPPVRLRSLEYGIMTDFSHWFPHWKIFHFSHWYPSSVCVEWAEENDHSGSYEASGILLRFFCLLQLCPFPRRAQRTTSLFLQIPKPWLRWDAVSFCSNRIILPLVICKYLLPSSWYFWRLKKKTTFR